MKSHKVGFKKSSGYSYWVSENFTSGHNLEENESCPETAILFSSDCKTNSYMVYALIATKGINFIGIEFWIQWAY